MSWKGNTERDDFTWKTDDGFLLRVEEMDEGVWWWDVITTGCIPRSWRDEHPMWVDAPSMGAAMYAAKCAYEEMRAR